jgi:hypothetical protein
LVVNTKLTRLARYVSCDSRSHQTNSP